MSSGELPKAFWHMLRMQFASAPQEETEAAVLHPEIGWCATGSSSRFIAPTPPPGMSEVELVRFDAADVGHLDHHLLALDAGRGRARLLDPEKADLEGRRRTAPR
jgi:hypothetical protein